MKNEKEGRLLYGLEYVSITPHKDCKDQKDNGGCKAQGACTFHLTPMSNQAAVTADEFLSFIWYTSFELLSPIFHVPGSSITHSLSELCAIYQEMQNHGEAYQKYLAARHQEVPTYGSFGKI